MSETLVSFWEKENSTHSNTYTGADASRGAQEKSGHINILNKLALIIGPPGPVLHTQRDLCQSVTNKLPYARSLDLDQNHIA